MRPFQDLQLSSGSLVGCQVMRLPGLLLRDGSSTYISLSGSFSCCSAEFFPFSNVIPALLLCVRFLRFSLPLSTLVPFSLLPGPFRCLLAAARFSCTRRCLARLGTLSYSSFPFINQTSQLSQSFFFFFCLLPVTTERFFFWHLPHGAEHFSLPLRLMRFLG